MTEVENARDREGFFSRGRAIVSPLRRTVRERFAHSWTVSRNDLNSKYQLPSSEIQSAR